MSTPAVRVADYADLCAVPEHLVAELMDGELHTSPRLRAAHSRASVGASRDISGPFDKGGGGPGGWWILIEPELHLGRPNPRSRVLVPDLAGWRREKVPVFPDVAAIETPPDWVCEVLSPATARLDRLVKSRAYAEAGVGHLWLLDPDLRSLEVYRNLAGLFALVQGFGGDENMRAEPFDAVEIELGAWWVPGGVDPAEGEVGR